MKKFFIDGLSGMAQGLFATLIIGTIIQQIGTFVRWHSRSLKCCAAPGKVAAAHDRRRVSAWAWPAKLDAGPTG